MVAINKVQEKIFEVIQSGDFEELERCYDGSNSKMDIYDENGMTPLMQASYSGNFKMCRYLLSNGANVNHACQDHKYTPLMMASLSGSSDVVSLLLDCGAIIDCKNSLGKTAANLAAFTGQQECLNKIRNYLSINKFDEYLVPLKGEIVARLPKKLVGVVRGLVTNENPHPVNIMLYIKDHADLLNSDVLGRCQNVLRDLCQKCQRTAQDYDEVLAIKLHYISCIVNEVRIYFNNTKEPKIDRLIKKMLHADGNGFPITVEYFIRNSMKSFPFIEMPAFREFVTTVSKTKVGSGPTSLVCLINLLNGLRASSTLKDVCCTCGKSKSELRCSRCKKAVYCTQRCQKLHWSVHKSYCGKLK